MQRVEPVPGIAVQRLNQQYLWLAAPRSRSPRGNEEAPVIQKTPSYLST